jgi:hypothetical protein
VILYFLVCGEFPFDPSNPSMLYRNVTSGNVTYPPFLSAGKKRPPMNAIFQVVDTYFFD